MSYRIFKECFPEYALTEELFNSLSEKDSCHILSENGGAAFIKDNKITFLAVSPECRHKGVGKRLLKMSEKYIKAKGYEYVYVKGLFPGVPTDVCGFFKANGYEAEEEYVDMGMDIRSFKADILSEPEDVVFCWHNGDRDGLLKTVAAVDKEWVRYFDCDNKVFCAYKNGRLASFCIVDESVDCLLSDGKNKVGSIGCVGTHPDFRKQGIGLYMVGLATEYLSEKGCDNCHIHYTSFEKWYGKLGYKTFLRFNPTEKKL